jgi:hypothetical protein
MPAPHPGQEWKHGWIPITPTAAVKKNHGRKPGAGSLLARVAAEAGEAHRRMQGHDSKRDTPKAPGSGDKKKPAPPTRAIASKPSGGNNHSKAPAPHTTPSKPAAKSGPKASENAPSKQGPSLGKDSAGKPVHQGDEVRVTNGPGQGTTGHVVSKDKSGLLRIRTSDGKEISTHSDYVRNRQDHDTSASADAAIRRAAGRDTPNQSSAGENMSIPEVQTKIEDIYRKIATSRDSGGYVGIDEIRDELGTSIPRAKVDEALRLMNRRPDVNVVPESNTKALTQRQRESAVHFGGQDKHLIAMY